MVNFEKPNRCSSTRNPERLQGTEGEAALATNRRAKHDQDENLMIVAASNDRTPGNALRLMT